MQICNAVQNLQIIIVACLWFREDQLSSYDDHYVWLLIAFIFLEFAIIFAQNTLGVT